MNISYNWLKRYIDITESPEEIAKILTSIGLEVGTLESASPELSEGLKIGEVVECVAHENSDHLHVAKVNVGEPELLQIVCGAPNCRAGLKTIVATIGTVLPDGDKTFTIKKGKLRGVESQGMLCAEDEIGIGGSHDGIIELPADAKVGMLAKDYYGGQSDTIIEVDITPNRSDAISHYGVARDLAAYIAFHGPAHKLTKPSTANFKVDNHDREVKVTVENSTACPRYAGITINNVTVKESPDWLKESLSAIGLHPINNVVDVTNFILHGVGQPLHCFDADKIAGGALSVKTLPEGTKFTTLDGVERSLNANDLMICDANGGSCIAGVFGGLNSGVTESTKCVFLECAYFNPVYVRKTARRHGLNTDASFRYERGCDPACNIEVIKYAAMLIKEVAGGEISSEITDIYPNEIKPFIVNMHYSRINSLIGKEIAKDEVRTILAGLEISILNENDDEFTVSVPNYRADVQRECDVIEDILRIYGYNNVTPDLSVKSSLSFSPKVNSYKLQNLISEQLTGMGFNEILNNSLTKSAYYDNCETFKGENRIMLMNPLSADLNCMRQTLLFGGLENISYNINRKNPNLAFYEFGNCYYYNGKAEQTAENPLKPYSEDYLLGMWLTGMKSEQNWAQAQQKASFYTLRAYVNNIFKRLGIKQEKTKVVEYSDDLLSYGLQITTSNGKVLVTLGIVSKDLCKKMDISQEVEYADVNWTALMGEMKNHNVTYHDIPKYPEVKRDLALLIDKKTTFAEIEKIARDTEKKLLKDVYLFDVYEGKTLDFGKKSYAVSFILQDEEKTLTDSQIDGIMNKLIKNFETKLEAKIR